MIYHHYQYTKIQKKMWLSHQVLRGGGGMGVGIKERAEKLPNGKSLSGMENLIRVVYIFLVFEFM